MAKTVAKRLNVDAQELWSANKGDASWRAAYEKFRAKGLSFTRAVEEASRTSTGVGPSTKTAAGKTRNVKRAGAKRTTPSGGGVGGVTPEEAAESSRYGRGQGKTKRGSKMRKATLKGDSSRIGQVVIKRAWAAARKAAGEARWAVMTKEQKTDATLRRVGPMTGEEAIGAVRALGSRVLPLTGSNDDVTKMIEDWAKSQGVNAPKTELKIGVKGKAEGKTGKETARLGGKGAKAPAGPEKPVEEKSPLGKKAKRIVRRRNRLDEILREGEDADSRTRRRAQKPTPDPDVVPGESEDERKARVGKAREEDIAFKEKYMTKIENEDGTTRWVRKEPTLPKGVKRRVVTLDVIVNTKPGKNKLGDAIKIVTTEKRKFNIYMKGKTVYVVNKNGTDWRKVDLDTYQKELLQEADPLTREERKYDKAKRVEGRPKSVKQEFGKKMETVSTKGKALNAEYITESATQAFIDANRKISEKNKIALGKGVDPDDLAPRYKVRDFVDAAYPNLGKAERSALISGIRRAFRSERKVRKTTRAAAKEARVIELRGETVEEGRKKLNAKDERVAKAKSAPLEKVKLESKAEGKRRARRVKTVGETISAVMDPSRSTPSAERMEPAPKQAKRIITPRAPGSELEMEIGKLRESLNPEEKRTFKKIKEVARLGFTKAQVKERASAGAFGKITPKVKKIARRAGYLGIVATALQFLQDTKPGKN